MNQSFSIKFYYYLSEGAFYNFSTKLLTIYAFISISKLNGLNGQVNKFLYNLIQRMSASPEKQEQQQKQQQGQQQQDPNSLTEQDKKVYAQIMGSISRMDKKIKHVKQKVPSQEESGHESKRTSVNQIAQKLIQSKQNSDIITKQDLVTDVQQTFQEMVVTVYTENQQMKSKINSLVAIIKDQNKKINQHKHREEKLQAENQKLREELMKMKDGHLMAEHHTGNKKTGNPSIVKNKTTAGNRTNTHENEDYDFWSMPNNESSAKKRKDFVADSGLWVNDKDIDKSVFITDNRTKK